MSARPTPGSLVIGDAVSFGWRAYWQNLAPLLGATVLAIAIEVGFGVVMHASGVETTAARILSTLVGTLVSFGLLHLAIGVTNGRRPVVSDLFRTDGFGQYLVASVIFSVGFSIGLRLFIVPGIVFATVFGYYGFVIVDEGPDAGILRALARSAELTRGNRWQLFGLGIVLVLLNVAGALAFFVGILFTLGISLLAWAYSYRTLKGETVGHSTSP